MHLVRYLEHFPQVFKDGVMTIGNFDGVHLGHQKVIQRVVKLAKDNQVPSLLMCFEPTPKEFFMADQAPARITTWRERYQKIEALGIDVLIQIPFNQSFANLDPYNFVKDILCDTLAIRHLIIGDDFHFGKDRKGNFQLLAAAGKELGFVVEDTKTLKRATKRVSSTAIREALVDGNFELVEEFLGSAYRMSGKVIHGQKLGRTLGFPTLNIKVNRQVSPLHGVYAVKVHGLDNGQDGSSDISPAIASIGTRPVVDGEEWLLEVYVIDQNGDYYGQRVDIEFCYFIRPERNFPNLELLQVQMQSDLQEAKDYFDL